MVVVAGIDVSKATLDVSVSEGPVLSFENSTTGIRKLLRHLERAGVTRAVCESTGGYERPVVGRLRETTIGVDVAHPVRVRAFARACGYEAKTDPLDAQVLSRYGVVFTESDTAHRKRILIARSCGSCWADVASLWSSGCGSATDWIRA